MSILNELNNLWRTEKEPKHLYHATWIKHIDDISKHGLGKIKELNYKYDDINITGNHVYLEQDEDTARGYMESLVDEGKGTLEDIIVFRVSVDDLDKDKLIPDPNLDIPNGSVVYKDIIKPEALILIED